MVATKAQVGDHDRSHRYQVASTKAPRAARLVFQSIVDNAMTSVNKSGIHGPRSVCRDRRFLHFIQVYGLAFTLSRTNPLNLQRRRKAVYGGGNRTGRPDV